MWSHSALAVATVTAVLPLFASDSPSTPITTELLRVDLTASAHPAPATTWSHDMAYRVDSAQQTKVRAATTATASATCRGCSGQAVSVHVIYLDAVPRSRLDNVAIAWDQGCRACRATAVSVQVVVVEHAGAIKPSNRAVAVNAACKRCDARSAAYQVIMAGKAASRLSARTVRALKTWARERARILQGSAGVGIERSSGTRAGDLSRLTDLVGSDLGSDVLAAGARLAGR